MLPAGTKYALVFRPREDDFAPTQYLSEYADRAEVVRWFRTVADGIEREIQR